MFALRNSLEGSLAPANGELLARLGLQNGYRWGNLFGSWLPRSCGLCGAHGSSAKADSHHNLLLQEYYYTVHTPPAQIPSAALNQTKPKAGPKHLILAPSLLPISFPRARDPSPFPISFLVPVPSLLANALPTTPERPKKVAKVAVSSVRNLPDPGVNDENVAPMAAMDPTPDYVASEDAKPFPDPEAKIKVTAFPCPSLLLNFRLGFDCIVRFTTKEKQERNFVRILMFLLPAELRPVVGISHELVSRSYARDHRGRSYYDLFGKGKPGDEEFKKSWQKKMNEETSLWTDNDEDEMDMKDDSRSNEDVKKLKEEAEERARLIDADDSDELRSVWSGSDEEKTLWTGDEGDDDDDIPTEAVPNERSDPYIDKLFEFEETPKYRTISELLKDEEEPKELSPGKQARKIAVENALKKLKKGPDGRYTNVWEVMTDIDILIGAFENIVSGPEYAELREGGPKKLNMQFFKDIQARMRDPNFKFSPELKLKPKSKLVSRKKWQKAQSRRRKAAKR
ncbi:hypothetical protein ACLOJK_018681 [Asimina triloba]